MIRQPVSETLEPGSFPYIVDCDFFGLGEQFVQVLDHFRAVLLPQNGYIDFQVELQTLVIQIVASNRGPRVINDRGFGVQHGLLKFKQSHAAAKASPIQVIGCPLDDFDVAFAGHQNGHRDSAFSCPIQRSANGPVGQEVRIGDDDLLGRLIDGVNVVSTNQVSLTELVVAQQHNRGVATGFLRGR